MNVIRGGSYYIQFDDITLGGETRDWLIGDAVDIGYITIIGYVAQFAAEPAFPS